MRYISASLAVAALAVSPAISAPLPMESSMDARDLTEDTGYFYARGAQATKEVATKAGKVIANTADALGQSAIKDKVNSAVNPPVDPPQGLKDAAKAATSPHDPAIVKAATNHVTGQKRSLLYGRGAQATKEAATKAGKVIANTADALGQSAIKDKVNSAVNPPVDPPQGLKDAAKAATSPHDPAIVKAATNHVTGQKRSLLYGRGAQATKEAATKAGKVIANTADALGQSAIKDKVNSAINPPVDPPQGLKDAAKAATSPHDPAIVKAATNHVTGQKRSLLYGRGAQATKEVATKAGKVIANTADALGQSAIKDKVNSAVNPPVDPPQGLKDAAKAATSPHDPAIVKAATNHVTGQKRSLLYGRGAQATKEVATKAGKVIANTADALGQSAIKDKVNSAVNPPVDPPQGLKDAAKAATSPHDPAIVKAATNHVTGQKRSLLYGRGAQATKEVATKAGKVIANTADALGQSAIKDKVNSAVNPPVDPPQGLKDAAKAATSPHDPAIVKAATNHVTGQKRELNARNPLLSYATKAIIGTPPVQVPQGLKDAAAAATAPHSPEIVQAATAHVTGQKRSSLSYNDLSDRDIIEILSREYVKNIYRRELYDLEEREMNSLEELD